MFVHGQIVDGLSMLNGITGVISTLYLAKTFKMHQFHILHGHILLHIVVNLTFAYPLVSKLFYPVS